MAGTLYLDQKAFLIILSQFVLEPEMLQSQVREKINVHFMFYSFFPPEILPFIR